MIVTLFARQPNVKPAPHQLRIKTEALNDGRSIEVIRE